MVKFETNSTDNVSIGKGAEGGYAWIAPKGTVVPTDNTSEWGAGFKVIGYINEDGVSFADSADSDDINDMSGDVIGTTAGAVEKTITFFAAEIKKTTLAMQYGDANVTDVDGLITVHDKGLTDQEVILGFDFVYKAGRKERYIAHICKLSELGEYVVNYQELAGREYTYKCLKDAATGDYVTRYIDSTETEAAGE